MARVLLLPPPPSHLYRQLRKVKEISPNARKVLTTNNATGLRGFPREGSQEARSGARHAPKVYVVLRRRPQEVAVDLPFESKSRVLSP